MESAHPLLCFSSSFYCIDGFLLPSTLVKSSNETAHSRRRSHSLIVRSAKRSSSSSGLQRETDRALSHILRTEASIVGVERKSNRLANSNRLSPRAVLEALDDAISHNRWEPALKIFELLRKQLWYQPQTQTYTKLIAMLGRCRRPEHARSLFRAMITERLAPTLDVYTSLVGAYGYSGLFDDAHQVLDEMKTTSDCKPDAYAYTTLINCCCKLRRFERIPGLLSEMSYLGIECSMVTYNAIIDGYGKAGMLEEMERGISDMLESGRCLPDTVTMNSIVSAYGNGGEINKMERWYNEFLHMGIEADVRTFNILIKSYGKAGMYRKMDLVMEFMRKRYFAPTMVTFNIIIECLGKAGDIEKMEYYFRLMKVQGVKPNSITYCSLVSGYTKVGLLEKVPTIIRQTENTDVILDTAFFNCVISAYGQSGDIKIMEEMFLLMKGKKCQPDSITFATMIRAYDSLGMVEAAEEFKLKMSKAEHKLLKMFMRHNGQCSVQIQGAEIKKAFMLQNAMPQTFLIPFKQTCFLSLLSSGNTALLALFPAFLSH